MAVTPRSRRLRARAGHHRQTVRAAVAFPRAIQRTEQRDPRALVRLAAP